MARTTTRSQNKETLSQFTARLKKKRSVELAQGRESVKRRQQEREISKIEKQVAGLGFTRADISDVRPDLFTRERTELVRGKITRTKTAPSRQLSRLEQKAFKRQFKKVNIVDKSGKGGTFFVKKDAFTKAEEKTKQRIPTTIIRGTPSGEQIVRLLAKQRTPERDKTITAERIITARAKEKIKAKPSTDITLKGLKDVIVKDVKKVTDFASEKISQSGLGKALNAVDALNEIKLKEAKAEKKAIENKTTLTSKDKRNLFLLNAKIAARSGTDVSVEFVKDFFKRPVQNAVLFGVGAGVQKAFGAVGLKVAGIQKTSPGIAATLKGAGVVGGVGLLTVYSAGVIKEANEELKSKGTLTETTAKALRELVVLGAGAQAGKSVKTAKLTELRKLINRAPKKQRVTLEKQFNKIKKLSEKQFLTKDIGKITKLESQKILNQVQGRTVKRSVTTATKDSLFVVKKGRVPKRSGKFEMTVTRFAGQKGKGLQVQNAVEQKVIAKFNSKTGKVEIVKVLKTKFLDPNVAKSRFTTLKKGQKELTKIRKIGVRGSQRTLKPGVKKGSKLIVDRVNPRTGKREQFSIERLDQPITRKADVKPSIRKLKERFNIKKSTKEENLLINTRGDSVTISEFKITPKTVKPKPKKVVVPKKAKPRTFKVVRNKVTKKFELVETRAKKTKKVLEVSIDKRGRVTTKKLIKRDIPREVKSDALKLIKAEPKLITKTVKVRPVTRVSVVKGKQKTRITPAKTKTKSKTQPRTKIKEKIVPRKPIVKPKTKPQVESKPIDKIKPITEPKIDTAIKSLRKVKPKTKSKTKQAQAQKQAQIPKQAQKLKQKAKAKLRVKKVKMKLPLIPFKPPKKKGKVKVKLTKKDVKPIKLQFTPTISGFDDKPRRKKKEFELFLFTGAEKR